MSYPVIVNLPQARRFFEKLVLIGRAGRFVPIDFLRMIAGECDFISVKNNYGYSGITQIGTKELVALGWSKGPDAFAALDPADQLDFSAKYFETHRRRAGLQRWISAAQLWSCNLAPAHLGREDGVVYDETENGPQYRANRWLDLAGPQGRPGRADKKITLDDLDAALDVAVERNRAKFELAVKNLNVVGMQLALRGDDPTFPTVDVPDLRDPWLSEVNFPEWPGGVVEPAA